MRRTRSEGENPSPSWQAAWPIVFAWQSVPSCGFARTSGFPADGHPGELRSHDRRVRSMIWRKGLLGGLVPRTSGLAKEPMKLHCCSTKRALACGSSCQWWRTHRRNAFGPFTTATILKI